VREKGSKSLGLKGFVDFNVGEVSKRNQYEELNREVKHLRQTTGLSIMVLEYEVSKLQEQLDNILSQRALLWQEMTQLQVQFGMQTASSEPEPMPQEFGSTFR
jgi:predicted  nucleic acid-binding Zn-ribbon protein